MHGRRAVREEREVERVGQGRERAQEREAEAGRGPPRVDAHLLGVANKRATRGLEMKTVPRGTKVLRRRPRRVTRKAKVIVVKDETRTERRQSEDERDDRNEHGHPTRRKDMAKAFEHAAIMDRLAEPAVSGK